MMKFEKVESGQNRIDLQKGQPDITAEATPQFFPLLRAKIAGTLENAHTRDKKTAVLDAIKSSRDAWFKGREEMLSEAVAAAEKIPYVSDAQFLEDVAHSLLASILKHLNDAGITLEEEQRRYKLIRIEQDGNLPLDKSGVLYCSKHGSTAEVHISEGLTPEIWKEALRAFAAVIEADSGIHTIKMRSWVVMEKIDQFQRLGFTVSEITGDELKEIRGALDESMAAARNKPWGEASMTRDEFLNSPIIKRVIKG